MAKLFDCRATDGLAGDASGFLPRAGWVATAFRDDGTDVPANAIDGNSATVWWNGAACSASDWFKIDCGAPVMMCGLTALNTGNLTDIVAAAAIQASLTDSGYVTQASHVAGDYVAGVLTKRFAPVLARYLKWQSTGATIAGGGNWWGVSEVNILSQYVQPRVGSIPSWTGTTGARMLNYTDPVSGLSVPTYPAKSTDFIQAAYATTLQQTSTWFADLYMDVANAGASGRVFVIGDSSGGGGPSLRVYVTGGTFQAVSHNGTDTATASTGALTWAIGARIRLRTVLNADGSVLIGAQINNAAEVTGTTAAHTFGAGAANQLFLTLGADYNASNKGSFGFRSVQAATGVLTAFPGDSGRWANHLGTRRGSRQAA